MYEVKTKSKAVSALNWLMIPSFTAAIPTQGSTRFHELDGIRGWSSVSVVFFHIFWETFGVVAPEFRNPVTGFLFDGGLAVAIFFLLSGEALSSSFFSGKGRRAVVKLAIKRYPRLCIPILASCLLMLVLHKSGLMYNDRAAPIVGRSDWLATCLVFPLDIIYTLKYVFVVVFIKNDLHYAIIPYLWTMRIELFGSIMVFVLLLLMPKTPYPRVVLILLTFILIGAPSWFANNLSCFTAGMIFADIRLAGGFKWASRSRLGYSGLIVIMGAGLTDGFCHWYGYDNSKPLFAMLILAAVFCNEPATRFFRSSLSRFLGHVSFPLYLVQYPVIISVTSWAILWSNDLGILNTPVIWLIGFGSFLACIVAALAFEPVEILTRRVGNRLAAFVT